MRPGRKIRDRSPSGIAGRRLYREVRRRKLCAYRCGRQPVSGRALCAACRDKNVTHTRDWVAARIAAGECRECGWPASRGTRCLTCRVKRKMRRGSATQRPHQPPWTDRSTGGKSTWSWAERLQL